MTIGEHFASSITPDTQVRNVAAASYGALRQDAAALAQEAERLGDELNAVLGSFDELQRDVAALEGEVTDEARACVCSESYCKS